MFYSLRIPEGMFQLRFLQKVIYFLECYVSKNAKSERWYEEVHYNSCFVDRSTGDSSVVAKG